MTSLIKMTDGYKLDHRRQYPPGTQYVYSNMTPRTTRVPGSDKVVFFGLQYCLAKYLTEEADRTFFNRNKDWALREYRSLLANFLGPQAVDTIGVDHIAALHDLGYIPLEFHALPEGTRVPLRVPMFTYINTLPEFYWVTNYFETLISSVIWQASTSATTADRFRKMLNGFARNTGGDLNFVPFQAHDFSFRGMPGPEAASLSGASHALSFTGSDSLPAIDLLQDYYGANGFIVGGVPATEHSVMCAGGKATELQTYSRLLDLYPEGIVSVVSDTWDLWNVITNILPQLKDKILSRNGKLVIRPDSGDPADILCGHPSFTGNTRAEHMGVIECLWETFGGTTDANGFRTLDSHIGAIYGDSITYDRAKDICERLAAKKFASTNVVLGVGSYTYQCVTRDTYGFAVKSTWTRRDDVEHMLEKNPKTDNGVKKSATGLLAVVKEGGELKLLDGRTSAHPRPDGDLLETVWRDGAFVKTTTLEEIRTRLAAEA